MFLNLLGGVMAGFSFAQQYEERVSSAIQIPIDRLPQELNQTLNNRIISFDWTKGIFPGSVNAVPNVRHLQGLPDCDLRILLAPLDLPERPNSYPGFKSLVALYKLPDLFLAERLHNVAYSFGSHVSDSGFQTLWMHLLMKDIPLVENPGPQEERGWTRTAFYLRWRESKSQPTDIDHGNASSPTTSEDENTNVTLVCFGAVKHFRQRCMEMRTSKSWASVLKDPYTLVGYFLESWYERVDRIVWSANDRGSKLETQTVQETSAANLSNPKSELRLEDLYRLLQAVIWLREGLEASLKAIELFIGHYRESTQHSARPPTRSNLLAEFIHRRELFRATQLRLISLHQRLESINNIIYSVAALRDHRLMYRNSEFTRIISEAMSQDSSKMATIAWIGVIFLPTSMVATVISAVYGNGETAWKMVKSLGILLAVSIPMTVILIFSCQKLIEPRSRRVF